MKLTSATTRRKSMGKIIWQDTETTGLNSAENAIIELAAIVEIDEKIVDSFSIQMAPLIGKKINEKALEINGRTIEEISKFPPLDIAMVEYKEKLDAHVNKFNTEDKFIVAGYNIGFDINFIRAAFIDIGDKYYGSYFFNCPLDVYSDVAKTVAETGLRLPNYKLVTVCDYFGIKIDAHNPQSDIMATRELYYHLESARPKYIKRQRIINAKSS